jgi:cytoskeletal protein CcmA (bactofilin family)
MDATTVIDAQANIEGTLRGKDAQVLGRFKGEIELTGRLVLGDGSHVDAKVVADAVEIGGQFKGDLKTRSLALLEKARVEGTVETQNISMREGAQLNGAVNAGGKGGSTSTLRPASGAAG